eukprot:TRINITY_DN11915_c0_g1_i1.p1 TRINITY_DN11915_c0_g1~~TRINITY_DN11915_c0_g1_i1.p1  ORF type:complete len:103 (-),score=9.14 TRINITY_DN11915_c0_g1_i1:275-583(-)
MFHSPFNSLCTALIPLFGELSLEYSKPNVLFGRLNISVCEKLAKDMRISIASNNSPQLPTIVLMHKGKELSRYPYYSNGNLVKPTWQKRDLIKHLGLESLRS